MWQVLLDPFHVFKFSDEVLDPQEGRWHEGKNQNRHAAAQASGSGKKNIGGGESLCGLN